MRRVRAASAILAIVLVPACGHSSAANPRAARSTSTSVGPSPTRPPTIPFHLINTASPPSCAQATTSGSAEAVVSAFRAARIMGKGAEGCVTAQGLSRYCGPSPCPPSLFSGPNAPSPGPICLYACNGKAVRFIAVNDAEKDPSGSISVELEVSAGPTTDDFIDDEDLFLGPGVPSVDSQRQPMVIVDVSTCC